MTSWTNQKGDLLMSSYKYEVVNVLDSYKIHMQFKIRRLGKNDFQKYKCSATNAMGMDVGRMKVYGKSSVVKSFHK